MSTDLRAQAIIALAAVRPTTNDPTVRKVRACAALRKTSGYEHHALRDLAAAVNWAMEQPTFDPERYRKPARVGWLYEFPNGHTASVIVDHRQPFRFEVLSDDPADAGQGRIAAGLTSEQTEAKLAVIAGLPTR
jgi:hypothetical protein